MPTINLGDDTIEVTETQTATKQEGKIIIRERVLPVLAEVAEDDLSKPELNDEPRTSLDNRTE